MKHESVSVPGCLLVIIFSVGLIDCALRDVAVWNQVELQLPKGGLSPNPWLNGTTLKLAKMILRGSDVWRNKIFFILDQSTENHLTLVYAELNNNTNATQSPPWSPYPDWETHQFNISNPVPGKLSRVRRIHVDVCDRLWILDHVLEEPLTDKHRIVIYDLNTNQRIQDHEILISRSGTITFLVDVARDDCDEAYLYVTSHYGYLTVYDLKRDIHWQSRPHLEPSDQRPSYCTYSVGNLTNVHSGALLAPQQDGNRLVYMQLLYFEDILISSKFLKNRTTAEGPLTCRNLGCPDKFSSSSVFDPKTGVLFQTKGRQVFCWNTVKSPNETSFQALGDFTINDRYWYFLQSEVDDDGNLWLLSRNYNATANKWAFHESEANYKVSSIPAAEAVKGTVCAAA